MSYATGYAMNTNDLFVGFPTNKLDLDTKTCEELIGNDHKEDIAKDVFKYAVHLVIDDLIENGNIFELPTKSRKAELKIQRVDGEDFIRFRKAGKWRDVDFLASDFGGHHMVFNLLSAGIMRLKEIYLDPKNRDRITDYTNKGKSYY